LRRAMNPLRPATITPNFYRVAHKEIVGHAGAYVYTARPGRLRWTGQFFADTSGRFPIPAGLSQDNQESGARALLETR
ncbi:MAG: hypothetical protein ACLQMO_10715, partial [Acidobacteriaceae bacterium]